MTERAGSETITWSVHGRVLALCCRKLEEGCRSRRGPHGEGNGSQPPGQMTRVSPDVGAPGGADWLLRVLVCLRVLGCGHTWQ